MVATGLAAGCAGIRGNRNPGVGTPATSCVVCVGDLLLRLPCCFSRPRIVADASGVTAAKATRHNSIEPIGSRCRAGHGCLSIACSYHDLRSHGDGEQARTRLTKKWQPRFLPSLAARRRPATSSQVPPLSVVAVEGRCGDERAESGQRVPATHESAGEPGWAERRSCCAASSCAAAR